MMRSWSSINVLCTEPGVATRTDPTTTTDPTTPPPNLNLNLNLNLNVPTLTPTPTPTPTARTDAVIMDQALESLKTVTLTSPSLTTLTIGKP